MKTFVTPVRAAVLGLLASVSVSAFSQSLKETVVTASRFEEFRVDAPMAVQVITKEDIANSGVSSVPDALRMLAGVNVRSNAPGQFDLNSAVDLGGFGVTATQNTLVLVDGRRLNPIDSSEIAWSSVALASVDRIEIANGGAAVQYGAGASGGVINIITKQATQNRSEVQASAGSFGTAQTSLIAERVHGDLSFGVNALALKSDGWRENSQAQAQNLMVRVKKVLDAHTYIFAELGAAQQTNGFPGGVVAKVGEGDQVSAKFNNVGSNNTVQQNNLRLGGFTALSALSSLDVDLSFTKKNSDFKQPYYDTADSFGPGYLTGSGRSKLDADQFAFSPKFKTQLQQGGSLVGGYDFSQATQNGASIYGSAAQQLILNNQGPYAYTGNIVTDTQSVQLINHSLYALARLPVTKAIEISAGWRRQLQNFDSTDINKSSGTQSSQGQYSANAYEIGFNLKSGPTSRYFVRINHSFRFANTDEYWGADPVTFNRVFSGELKPQYTRAYEIGHETLVGEHQLGVSLGQSITQDEIRYNPTFFRNSNLTDDVFRTSLVANYNYRHRSGGMLVLGARLQRAEFLNGSFSGQTLGLVPYAIYNATWLQPLDARTKVGLSIMQVSKQNYDLAPDIAQGKEQMPAYTTADLFWAKKYGKFDAKVTVRNLTGSVYSNYGGYSFVQAPGAGGASNYYYFPSDPRSVHLNLTYRF